MAKQRWAIRRDSFNPIPLNAITALRVGQDLIEIDPSEIPAYKEMYLNDVQKRISKIKAEVAEGDVTETASTIPLNRIGDKILDTAKDSVKKPLARDMKTVEIIEELARDFNILAGNKEEGESAQTFRGRLIKTVSSCRNTGFPPDDVSDATTEEESA